MLHNRLFGERRGHFITAAIALPLLAVGVIWAATVANNFATSIRTIGHQIGGTMIAAGMVPQPVYQLANPLAVHQTITVKTLKGDFGVMPDAEAEGDIADAELADAFVMVAVSHVAKDLR